MLYGLGVTSVIQIALILFMIIINRTYDLLIKEDSDVALIRLFECFLESTPQKILQISIILSGEDTINSE